MSATTQVKMTNTNTKMNNTIKKVKEDLGNETISLFISIFTFLILCYFFLSYLKNLLEIIENKNHPWFLAVQFHPELKSKPFKPHPIFLSFIKSCNKKNNEQKN